MKILKVIFLILLCGLCPIASFGGEASFKDEIIIAGSWGKGVSEFGKETSGKTETGSALEFTVYNKQIFIYDGMNNRIQIYDLDGKFIKIISLNFNWLNRGVLCGFTIIKNYFFAIIGRPPYYSIMNGDIYKISPNGELLNNFGSKQLNKNKEEYFSKIKGSDKTGEIYCGIGGSTRIAAYAFDGSFIGYLKDVKSAPQIMLNAEGHVDKNAPHFCSWMDNNGNCYKIWSNASRSTNNIFSTHIQIFPHNFKNSEDMIAHEVSGDIKFVKDGKDHTIRYNGNFEESSFVDSDGTIYHLIALDDGVALHRIAWHAK
jgi:hypothetical protein